MVANAWNLVKKSKTFGSEQFLRIRPESSLTVRLVTNPVQIIKVFNNDRHCAIVDTEETANQLKTQYPSQFSDISIRYACWCIDREDNSLKILDMPVSVARAVGRREAILEKKIASDAEGCDWRILSNGKKGKEVRYEAVFIEETPLTQAEKQMIEDRMKDAPNQFDLRKVFRPCSYAEAEKKLFS